MDINEVKVLRDNFFRLLNSNEEQNVMLALEMAANLPLEIGVKKYLKEYKELSEFLYGKQDSLNAKLILQIHTQTVIGKNDEFLRVLPPAIKKMQKLEELDLSYCCLQDLPLQIMFLKHLKKLDLKHNCFTRFPVQICQLKKLENLYLSYNRFTEIPIEISQLINLKCLQLVQEQPILQGKQQRIQSWLPGCSIVF